MVNRFTDSEKWNDPWYCSLPPLYKLFWNYLCDNCNHGGIWKVNWSLVNFHIGQIEFDPVKFDGRIKVLSKDKWFIEKSILFQQKINSLEELNPENNAHCGILRILENEGLRRGYTGAIQGLGSPPGKGKGKGKELIPPYTNIQKPLIKHNTNKERGKFVPPTVGEVEEYCRERNNGIDPGAFMDSNEAKGWVIGKNKTPAKDWKAMVRTWERNNNESKELHTKIPHRL